MWWFQKYSIKILNNLLETNFSSSSWSALLLSPPLLSTHLFCHFTMTSSPSPCNSLFTLLSLGTKSYQFNYVPCNNGCSFYSTCPEKYQSNSWWKDACISTGLLFLPISCNRTGDSIQLGPIHPSMFRKFESESRSVMSDSLQPHGLYMEFSRQEYCSG